MRLASGVQDIVQNIFRISFRLSVFATLIFFAFTASAAGELLGKGILTSAEELAVLPTSGAAYQNVLSYASQSTTAPNLSNQDDNTNVRVLAKALVYARTGQVRYRDEVIQAVMAIIGTEAGGRTLALGRELGAYVIAADLVKLPADKDSVFRQYLAKVRNVSLEGRTLISTHEDRPNNWGTMAGGSRVAVAAYLGDTEDLARAATVLNGYLGDRASYAGFQYGDLSWQCDPTRPVGINPKGCSRDGHSIDGVLPDEQRRSTVNGGAFTWPPPKEPYVYEGLQGVLLQALILYRAGYDVFNWQDQAILRSFAWLHTQANYPADGDDQWQPHVVNFFYKSSLPAIQGARPGKNVGFTDWIYGAGAGTVAPLPTRSPASSPTPSPTPVTVTTLRIAAAADTTIKQRYSTRNYGASTELLLDQATNASEDVLLKFRVSGIGTRRVIRARLLLKVLDSSDHGGRYYRVSNEWSESSVTWKSAPAAGSLITSVDAANTTGQTISVPVESYVNADGTYSFRIRSSSVNKLKFNSRESDSAPVLVLDLQSY